MSEQVRTFEIKLSDDSDEEDHDTGKSNGDFPLWAAQQALESAETCLSEIEDSRSSLTKNATSFIGWSVSLSVALTAFVGKAAWETPTHLAAIGALLFTTSASWCSLKAVSVRGWHMVALHPDQWMPVIDADEPLTEMQIIRERLKSLGNAIDHNADLIDGISRYVRCSTYLLTAMPAVSPVIFAVVKMALYLSS